jgi:hypothetical protein
LVETLEQVPTRDAAELLARPPVELVAELEDPRVQLAEREEGLAAKPGEDPSLRHLHGDLDLGLVLGLPRPRRNDRGRIMSSELGVGPRDSGLVRAGAPHCAAELVGDDDRRYPAEVRKRAHVGGHEILGALALACLGVGRARRAQHGDEELDLADLAGRGINDSSLLARVVDEHLLAATMHLPHRDLLLAHPASVDVAEGGVPVAGWVGLEILQMEQLQRHARSFQLRVNPHRVR